MTSWKLLAASAVALLCAASILPQQAALAQGMMQQTQAAPPRFRWCFTYLSRSAENAKRSSSPRVLQAFVRSQQRLLALSP